LSGIIQNEHQLNKVLNGFTVATSENGADPWWLILVLLWSTACSMQTGIAVTLVWTYTCRFPGYTSHCSCPRTLFIL